MAEKGDINWAQTLAVVGTALAILVVWLRWVNSWFTNVLFPWRDRAMLKRLETDPGPFDDLLLRRLRANSDRERERIVDLFRLEAKEAENREQQLLRVTQMGEANASALRFVRASLVEQGKSIQELSSTRTMMSQLNQTMNQLDMTMRSSNQEMRKVMDRLSHLEGRAEERWNGEERRQREREKRS